VNYFKSDIDSYLSNLSLFQVYVIVLFLVIGVSALDFATGYEISFSLFYLIPISIAAWYGSFRSGVIVSVVSAVTWATVDLISGHSYSHIMLVFWNASVRFGFFIITTSLLFEIHSLLERIQETAQKDALTELFNGRAFLEIVQRHINLLGRLKRPIALGYIDIDNFKMVNDTYGHSEGDRVLRTIGLTLKNCSRKSDISARIGGDEFAVLLPDTNIVQAHFAINKLHEELTERVNANRWPIGFSIGVVVLDLPNASSEELLNSADNLMYRVKKSTKNRVLYEEYKLTEET
jgi:diguanylate cyclase (GGDEF)-like protein